MRVRRRPAITTMTAIKSIPQKAHFPSDWFMLLTLALFS
jgi:hypothetical protein